MFSHYTFSVFFLDSFLKPHNVFKTQRKLQSSGAQQGDTSARLSTEQVHEGNTDRDTLLRTQKCSKLDTKKHIHTDTNTYTKKERKDYLWETKLQSLWSEPGSRSNKMRRRSQTGASPCSSRWLCGEISQGQHLLLSQTSGFLRPSGSPQKIVIKSFCEFRRHSFKLATN